MNLSILKNEKSFIKTILATVLMTLAGAPAKAWDVDLSRRVKSLESKAVDELRWPTGMKSAEELFSATPVHEIFNSVEPAQSIVILNTEQGFVPDTIRIRKDGNYKIYVTNVNEQFKNASFILDSFGQTHGTYFGKPKSFELIAKVNGIFTFLCPETGSQGKFVVISDKEAPPAVAVSDHEAKK